MILALGDSFTFGMGVEGTETYPAQLERILQERGNPVEVINCAVVGHDMWQHNVMLRKLAYRYRPDLVLLGIFVNDLIRSLPPAEVGQHGYQGANPFAHEGARSWLHRIRLYNAVRNLEDSLKYRFRARFGADYLRGIAERKRIWGPDNPADIHYQLMAGKANARFYRAFRSALADFVYTATEANCRVMVLLIPDSVQLHDDTLQAMNRFIKVVAADLRIEFLDLTPVLESEKDPESLYLFPDDAHNSPKGLHIVAEAIANTLERGQLQAN